MTTIYGYIRFSFFGRNDTRISRNTADDAKRFELLYNPQRMEERFYFFERITLPSLRAQVDQDFKILLVSSEVMPEAYKHRLNALVADIPQIEVIYSSAANIKDELNPRIAEMTAGIRKKTVHFRLDDDDAICAQMIGLLRETAPLARKNELLSFPRGFFLTMEDGAPRLVRKFEPYIAIGWAYVNRPNQVRNPYQRIHNTAHHQLPSMLNPRPFAYIHVSHDSSDTKNRNREKLDRAKNFDPKFNEEREKIDQQVQAHFPGFTLSSLEDVIQNAPGRKERPTVSGSIGNDA
jgi:hypothetical protein